MLARRHLIIGLAGAAALAVQAIPAAAQVKWDLSTVWPETNFHTQNARRFADEVKKATNGAVEITVKSGGQLGFKGPEHLRAVRDGLVPMADILNIQQIGDEPLLGTEGIPFLVGNGDELKVLHKYLRAEYEKVAEKNNQKMLYTVPWPTQYLHLKAKSDTVDGLKGIKVRVPDKNAADMVNAFGMSGILIPWGETIPALASGAVAGVSTSAVSGVDGKVGSSSNTSTRRTTSGRRRSSPSISTSGRSSKPSSARRSRRPQSASSPSSGRPPSRPIPTASPASRKAAWRSSRSRRR